MENTKKCPKCGRELPLDQFYKVRFKSGNAGYSSWCRCCSREATARWARNNSEKVRVAAIRWKKNNPEKVKIIKARSEKNNLTAKRKGGARWRQNHPEYKAAYLRKRRINKPGFKMMENIRRAMNLALKNNTKVGHTTELLGCSIEELRDYLERLFLPGMTWGNYGKDGWHIDHIIPLSYFDMSNPEQQKRAWHYTNLQPLWAKDNIRKSNKIIEQQLVLL